MTDLTLPTPSPLTEHFRLDPGIVYLNHGSFGACPNQVIEAQQRHRDRVEGDAMQFYLYDLWEMVDRSRDALGALIGASARDLVFVNNATTAVATVLHNLKLDAGDELIVTNYDYPACINNFMFATDRAGAKVVTAQLPWDGMDEDSVVDSIMSKVTDRTKLVLLSLITSATAVRLPVERLIRELAGRGVETLLDAAHGPGCVAMDVDAWGAAYTTGNGHKWLCSPKGVAFLHVRKDLQEGFRPLVLSNHAQTLEVSSARTKRTAMNHEFDYMGTDDRSAVLSIADSIAFLEWILPGGIDAVMEHNHRLCLEARDVLCEILGTEPVVPESMIGALAVIDVRSGSMEPRELRERLFAEHRIETMIVPSPNGGPTGSELMVRVSPQVYNSVEQYVYLGESILRVIGAK
jgi:isopenicillin-N epimerase